MSGYKKEYILVLVVIGILVVILFPTMSAVLTKSKASQAVATMVNFENSVEECLERNSDIAPGTAPCTLSITPLGIWAYYIGSSKQATFQTEHYGQIVAPKGTGQDPRSLTYSLVASDGVNTVTLTRTTKGQFVCQTGTNNPYTGVC